MNFAKRIAYRLKQHLKLVHEIKFYSVNEHVFIGKPPPEFEEVFKRFDNAFKEMDAAFDAMKEAEGKFK